MDNKETRVSPLLLSAGIVVVLLALTIGAYSYGVHRTDGKINDLSTELSTANTKITSLTPSTSGQFDRAKAVLGQKFAYDNWLVFAIDQNTKDVTMTPSQHPTVVTGLFFNGQDGDPCLLYEQMGLESGTLPSVVGQSASTFCASGNMKPSLRNKFGKGKSYSWASVEVSSLVYTDHGALAEIENVKSVTLLVDNQELVK